ncbi:hypothetical protein GGQ74_001399 [Desulfobaculum xiamenense]|uniref:Cell division protein FtsL n=1 Tax=Desulfobaculum xiamenense TaxID=995050 RepID=A0A846QSY7_9BACT|nr:hypothetical protein [Desulfobaculum xiamenense]NJB67759.1 hypothetical protein [Desulfobaculum xiamenense]
MKLLRDWRNGVVALLLLLSLLLGLVMVWCNIERMDLAYNLKEQQDTLEEREALVAKLEVERDNLLSPHGLRQLAEELGLGPASPGRIRRLDDRAATAEPQQQERP